MTHIWDDEKTLLDRLDGWRRQREEQRRFAKSKLLTAKTATPGISESVIEENLWVVALDISTILKDLHNGTGTSDPEVVGNLTPSSIGFDDRGRAKLKRVPHNKKVDFRYRAPEAMTAIMEHVDVKCDVYSFAVILWEIATLEIPYESILSTKCKGIMDGERYDRSRQFQRELLVEQVGRKNVRPKLSKRTIKSQLLRDLLKSCWDPNPDSRPPMARVWYTLHHNIFPSIVKNNLTLRTWSSNCGIVSTSTTTTGSTSISSPLTARVVPYLSATNKRLTNCKDDKNTASTKGTIKIGSYVKCGKTVNSSLSPTKMANVDTKEFHSKRTIATTECISMGYDDDYDDESVYSDVFEYPNDGSGEILHYYVLNLLRH
jgi:Protein tyrosine and serine/threonine kinase